MLRILPEVEAALHDGRPVVALESTVIAHGMPRPQNLEVARSLRDQVRQVGVIPATVALVDGQISVGLDEVNLVRLAADENVAKVSCRDLATVLAEGRTGATTVAATMRCAHLAGIPIMATGGIGGVHRGGQDSFDISADLTELGRTPVAVVCSGAKSILDLPRTVEVLETLGVPVIGMGTDHFPAFFCRGSRQRVDARCDSPEEIAKILALHFALPAAGGVVVAQAVPDAHALDEAKIEEAILAAMEQAQRAGILGKALTPFLLAALVQATEGKSLKSNIALLEANAGLAARIAKEGAAQRGG
ncbi:MAG: pseudouridine-5'-phosphate glycosidase [Deltaproteobacteria bacterium]|nr:pseudouridine-5'-phosphate glycosidase [Deltaproteobacteria bacterium]